MYIIYIRVGEMFSKNVHPVNLNRYPVESDMEKFTFLQDKVRNEIKYLFEFLVGQFLLVRIDINNIFIGKRGFVDEVGHYLSNIKL